MRLISVIWTSYLTLYIFGKYASNSLFQVTHILVFSRFPSCFYLLCNYEEFLRLPSFLPKMSVVLGTFGFRLGNLGMKPVKKRLEEEPANVFQGCAETKHSIHSAEGGCDQRNCDSDWNPSRGLSCVFTQLPYLMTVVFWEMIIQ